MPIRLATLLVLSSVCFVGTIYPQNRIPGEIIVQLNQESSVDQLLKNIPVFHLEIRLLSKSWNIWLLIFPKEDDEVTLNMIRKNPAVQLAQFNHRVKPRAIAPNDTLFQNQWNLENTGQSNGTPGADISAIDAWNLGTNGVTATGDTIVIAVVDEGFYLQHEDLLFWKNRLDVHNGIDDDQNGYIDDYNGWNIRTHSDSIPNDAHGTHIAGIAAAIGNNVTGITGVAWNAFLMPVSIPDFEESQVVEAYSYIFDMRELYNTTNGQKGAFIVASNSSFGWDFGEPEDYPLWCAMYDSLGKVGILSIGSTANITYDVEISGDIPSLCPSDHLIITTNTTRFDTKSTTTAFGKISVDLGAPGTAIYSTTPNNSYSYQSGTSMSAAHVTGAVAMMYSVACPDFILDYYNDPDSISLIVKEYILKGTDILHDLDGLTVSGGRLNLYNSMHMLYNESCITCLQLEETITNISCNGDSDGTISLSVSLGVPPYSYEWSAGQSGSLLSGLPHGKYSVKVSDSSGCEKFRYFEITQPDLLVVNLTADSAVNGINGKTTAFVKGGTAPYFYLWNDSLASTDDMLDNLQPGDYSVTVTDANGCQAFNSITVGNIVGISFPVVNRLDIKVHPNPVESIVRIEISSPKNSPSRLCLYDVSGKMLIEKIISGNNIFLDCSTYSRGSYFVKLINEQTVVLKKIIRL